MKFSTRGRYGLMAMLDLAVHSKGDQVPLFIIAERQGISANYLEQLFALLKKAGLVKSIKGAQGGYLLARNPRDLTVGDILRVLEGELSVIEASDDGSAGKNSIQECIRVTLWEKMNRSLNEVADAVTLEDLLESYLMFCKTEADMYYI